MSATQIFADRLFLAASSSNDSVQTVASRRSAGEQIGFLAAAGALCHQLAGIPKNRVTVGDFVDGKITFKHTAGRPEGRDTGFNIRTESRGYLFRRWRFGVCVKAQGSVALPQATELDVN